MKYCGSHSEDQRCHTPHDRGYTMHNWMTHCSKHPEDDDCCIPRENAFDSSDDSSKAKRFWSVPNAADYFNWAKADGGYDRDTRLLTRQGARQVAADIPPEEQDSKAKAKDKTNRAAGVGLRPQECAVGRRPLPWQKSGKRREREKREFVDGAVTSLIPPHGEAQRGQPIGSASVFPPSQPGTGPYGDFERISRAGVRAVAQLPPVMAPLPLPLPPSGEVEEEEKDDDATPRVTFEEPKSAFDGPKGTKDFPDKVCLKIVKGHCERWAVPHRVEDPASEILGGDGKQ